jgi:hypothetical protein
MIDRDAVGELREQRCALRANGIQKFFEVPRFAVRELY